MKIKSVYAYVNGRRNKKVVVGCATGVVGLKDAAKSSALFTLCALKREDLYPLIRVARGRRAFDYDGAQELLVA